ncbi:MAG: hypothetical protein MK041_09540 [Aquabacterium sp.]|nr:hypothetical protein [Dechloromonas sp.]MCH2242157.1 hypothetical protein [Aquabacterium sp.]
MKFIETYRGAAYRAPQQGAATIRTPLMMVMRTVAIGREKAPTAEDSWGLISGGAGGN